jgi:hypothetical protein
MLLVMSQHKMDWRGTTLQLVCLKSKLEESYEGVTMNSRDRKSGIKRYFRGKVMRERSHERVRSEGVSLGIKSASGQELDSLVTDSILHQVVTHHGIDTSSGMAAVKNEQDVGVCGGYESALLCGSV